MDFCNLDKSKWGMELLRGRCILDHHSIQTVHL